MKDRKEYFKQWHLANKERRKTQSDLRYKEKKELILKQTNDYYHNNKDKRKQWTEANKEKLSEYFKDNYYKNPLRKKSSKYLKQYKITIEDYSRMHQQQNGCCLGCGRNEVEIGRVLVVDHCHKTMKVRGLLCNGCNSTLGFAYDNPEVLRTLAKYLEDQK